MEQEARIADIAPLRAALKWHFRQTLVRQWCSEEIRKRAFRDAESGNEFAIEDHLIGE